MARMFNRRFRRPFNRMRKPTKWSAVAVQGAAVATATLQELPIVVAGDYAPNTALSPSGCTLVRCVGTALIYPTANATTDAFNADAGRWIITAGIAHIDTDEGTGSGFSPGSQSNLIDERWLAYYSNGSMTVATSGAGGGTEHVPMWKWDFDIKQKVRLRDSGISMLWIWQNLSGGLGTLQFQCSLTCRSLLRGEFT